MTNSLSLLIYSRLGVLVFILLIFALIASLFVTRKLTRTRQGLERRVKEMVALQSVGQSLSASLDLDNILWSIYVHISYLIPVQSFFVALSDPESDELSFPLVVHNGELVQSSSPRAGSEVAEHILHSRKSLLVGSDTCLSRSEAGLDPTELWGNSFLGVPILAGQDILGVIVVQTFDHSNSYDSSHLELLRTIAAQAAMAIKNARLYARTDEALAHRLREIDSILTASGEGILLLDRDYRILTTNLALYELLDLPHLNQTPPSLLSTEAVTGVAWLDLIGYSESELRLDCQNLTVGMREIKKRIAITIRQRERQIERKLLAVYDPQGVIIGWLLNIMDITEEWELERLREEMTNMLVHDLRSPLSTLQGSLNVIEENLNAGNDKAVAQMLSLAQRSCEKTLGLINLLLEIGQFEGSQIPLQLEVVEVESSIKEAVSHYLAIAGKANISIRMAIAESLPPLYVDPVHFGRVLDNLLDNAYKFTPDGGEIDIKACWPSGTDPQSLLISVSDTGPGISNQDQARLFKKFQQPVSKVGRRTGTGLGLVYCKLVVEAHGGKIWVESELGRGSTFNLLMPFSSGKKGTSVI